MIFNGVYTPVITTFHADLSIDYGTWGQCIDHLIDKGVHGIIVGGSTGEYFTLTDEERIAQFAFAGERIAGRVPLIAGVNHMLSEGAVKMAAAARDAGADALLVAAPPYALPSQEELVNQCLKIDRAADLPIMLYNYPARTGVSMESEFLRGIAHRANFCAIKESSGEPERIPRLIRDFPNLQLSAGSEDRVLEFFVWGARSWVSVVSNFMPAESVALWELCVNQGDFLTGRRLMHAIHPLAGFLEHCGKFIPAVKFACEVKGRPGGPCRPPHTPLTEATEGELRRLVETGARAIHEILGSGG